MYLKRNKKAAYLILTQVSGSFLYIRILWED